MKELRLSPQGEPLEESGSSGFWDHISELRRRLLYVAYCLVIGVVAAWIFREQLYQLVTAPIFAALAPYGITRLIAIQTSEAMMVYVKLAFVASLIVTLPFSIYQLWAFVRPGLLPHEYRPIRRIVILAMFFFVYGALFSYKVVLPFLIDFMVSFTLSAGDVDFQLTMSSAYSTTLSALLMFGIIFELPLAMVLLTALPILSWRIYVKYFKHAFVLSFIVGAVLTPPDVISQTLMAIPMTGLYGLGVLMSYFMERARLRPRSTAGPDWILMGSVGLTLAAMVPLAWPGREDPFAVMPAGMVKAVSERGPGIGEARCSGLPALSMGDSGEAGWACAVYEDGALMVAQGVEVGLVSSWCGGVESSGGRCMSDGDLVAGGDEHLVAGFEANRGSLGGSVSPLAGFSGAGKQLYVSSRASGGREASWLLAVMPEGDEGRVSTVISASSLAEATGYVRQVEGGGAARGRPGGGPVVGDLVMALDGLAGSVELLASSCGELPEPERDRIAAAVALARQMVGDGVGGGSKGTRCEAVGCYLGELLKRVHETGTASQSGRMVNFTGSVSLPGGWDDMRSAFMGSDGSTIEH